MIQYAIYNIDAKCWLGGAKSSFRTDDINEVYHWLNHWKRTLKRHYPRGCRPRLEVRERKKK